VFEYGGGGSTVWLGQRVGEVITVEHSPYWASAIEHVCRRLGLGNVQVLKRNPEPGEGTPVPGMAGITYGSTSPGSFKSYVTSIADYPDESFDIVLVDGESRLACLVHGCQKLKPGGTLILDDSERTYYAKGNHLFERWPQKDIGGLRPLGRPNRTTFWTKPKA
jgi:hypothetical protein